MWGEGFTGLHLNQLVDVGRVTRGEAAEDYQDLAARVSWHVPSCRDGHQLSGMQSHYRMQSKTKAENLLQSLYGQAERVVQGWLA